MVTIFYHAGVHCYTLLATKRFLVEEHLLLENCPGQSPDLNVIEALWWEMNNKKAPTKKKTKSPSVLVLLPNGMRKILNEKIWTMSHSMPQPIEAIRVKCSKSIYWLHNLTSCIFCMAKDHYGKIIFFLTLKNWGVTFSMVEKYFGIVFFQH